MFLGKFILLEKELFHLFLSRTDVKYKDLPSHVRGKIIAFKQIAKNKVVTETLVKFSKPSKSLEKMLKKYDEQG